MPWYKFSRIGNKFIPYAEVTVWHGAQHVRLIGVVDSGADVSMIDASYAAVLGLDFTAAQTNHYATASGAKVACLRGPQPASKCNSDACDFPLTVFLCSSPPGQIPPTCSAEAIFFNGSPSRFGNGRR